MSKGKQSQFVAVPSALMVGLENRALTGNALKVYCVIRSFAPRPFLTVRTMALKAGLNRKTVHKYLNILEGHGVIKRHKRFGTSSLYEINPTLMDSKGGQIMRSWVKNAVAKWHLSRKRYNPQPEPVPISAPLSKTIHISMVADALLKGIGNGSRPLAV